MEVRCRLLCGCRVRTAPNSGARTSLVGTLGRSPCGGIAEQRRLGFFSVPAQSCKSYNTCCIGSLGKVDVGVKQLEQAGRDSRRGNLQQHWPCLGDL